MFKAFKFKIEPTKQQLQQIEENFGCCRFVYNYFLDKCNYSYKQFRKSLSKFDCIYQLTELKKRFIWLSTADSVALQNSISELFDAFSRFFSHQNAYPKFKLKKFDKQSYTTLNNNSIRLVDNTHIKLPKLGNVRIKLSKQLEGKIKRATISKSKSGKYYVSLCCNVGDIPQLDKTGSIIGIDLGIKDFLIDSNGNKIENPHCYVKAQQKLAKLQRQLSRKSKGSKNRDKARIKLAKLSEHVANQRNDFQHKLSKKLVEENDIICCESLKVKNMIKNHKLAKHIQDCSWGSFISKLEYKCQWYGKTLIKIDTFLPSSQTCSNCGYKLENITLDIREWICPECGIKHDRDINAARNILNFGLQSLN